MISSELIEKEQITNLKFILSGSMVAIDLHEKLAHVAKLGNNFKTKASIVFSTESGIKRVETTVWATTDNFILLKGNVFVPISSIISVTY